MGQLLGTAFPLLTVEVFNNDIFDGLGVQASGVDANSIGIGSRHIEGFDPADSAEEVTGNFGIEGILGQLLATAFEIKAASRHNQMQIGGGGTDRAVAELHLQLRRSLDLKAYRSAVTASGVKHQRHLESPRLLVHYRLTLQFGIDILDPLTCDFLRTLVFSGDLKS